MHTYPLTSSTSDSTQNEPVSEKLLAEGIPTTTTLML